MSPAERKLPDWLKKLRATFHASSWVSCLAHTEEKHNHTKKNSCNLSHK